MLLLYAGAMCDGVVMMTYLSAFCDLACAGGGDVVGGMSRYEGRVVLIVVRSGWMIVGAARRRKTVVWCGDGRRMAMRCLGDVAA